MKKVAILSFFPAFQPPRSGGELRLSQMAGRLARRFDVQMISTTYPDAADETIQHAPHFRERRIPKSGRYITWHRILKRAGGFEECSGLVCSLAARGHVALREAAEDLVRDADIVIHESPFLFPLAPRPRHSRQLLVYNSYNVESRLARDMFGRKPVGRLASGHVARVERKLVERADLVFACSQEDEQEFVHAYGADRSKIHIVPNGVTMPDPLPKSDPELVAGARARLKLNTSRASAFFIGSFHPPNSEAVHFLLTRIAPALEDVMFFIAGKVCDGFSHVTIPANVRMLGPISDETKSDLMAVADVALNPMFSGSGTNLKMLDYLAAGVPVVTTSHGARGLGIEHLRHAVVADSSRFLRAITDVLGDAGMRERLARAGRELVRMNFSSDRIGDQVAEILDHKSSRRTIMLNDYAITPADAGGRIRIDAEAHALAAAGQQVTILTLNSAATARRVEVAPGVEELNIPRSNLHNRIDSMLGWVLGCSGNDATALIFARPLDHQFTQAVRREARFAEAAIFCHCYLEPFRRDFNRGTSIFFDSHNEEWRLKKALYRPGMIARFLVSRVRAAEASLSRRADAVFCVSAENLTALSALAPNLEKRATVIPNGVACGDRPPLPRAIRARLRVAAGLGPEFTATFLGSGHPPNSQAVRRIIDDIAVRNPNTTFLIIGSVGLGFGGEAIPANIILMNTVSESVKRMLLRTSDLAINPMEVGSGTSLKLFDYLAAGLPVLTTPLGARGLTDDVGGAVIHADLANFSETFTRLVADPDALEPLRENAWRAARARYDWPVVLSPMIERIRRAQRPGGTDGADPAGALVPALAGKKNTDGP